MYKKLSASAPDLPPGALPLDPTGGSAPDPRLGSRSARSPWFAPLANPGSATDSSPCHMQQVQRDVRTERGLGRKRRFVSF